LLDAKRGVGAVTLTLLARILSAGINLLTGIVSARVLGTDGRGEMSAMLVWPMLLAYLLTLGLPSAIRYWIRREPDRRSEFFTVSFISATLASLVAIAIGVLFIPLWLHAYSASVVHGAQILMIFSPEVMLALLLTAMLETLGEYGTANASRYLTVILQLLTLVVLAVMHRLTPFTGALAYTSGPVLLALWMIWKLRAHFAFRFFDPRPAIRLLASYGLRSYGIDLLNTISTQVDQVLVIAFLSASNVGIYVVALNASRVVNILHTAVVVVVFPTASGLEQGAVVDLVGHSARISTVIAVAFGAALVVLLPFILPLFYGSAFAGAIPVAQLLTLEAVLGGLASVLAQAFMALGRPGIVTAVQALGLATVLPLMVVLLPHFGLLGAAIALVASTAIRLVCVIWSYPVILGAPVPKLLPTRDDFRRVQSAMAGR
jgi:O-antigen/teichoic acid export membrane protein